MSFPNRAYVVGLAYANGNLIASVTNNGSDCFYQQINVSSGTPVLSNVTAPAGTASGTIFSSTDMATLITGVGAAKNVSSVQTISGNLWQVQYNVKVRNYGNVNLTNVQVSDNLAAVFGSAFHGASVAAVGTLPSGMAVNPAFNGSTDTLLFAAGGTMVASPPDSAIVRVTVILNNPSLTTTYYNSAIATATGTLFSEKVRDSSDYNSTLNPDPAGNDVPDQTGQGIPTPLILDEWTVLANTLVDFNGEAGSDVNNLHWTVQDPQAGSTISIQRSADGQQFTTLADLSVSGTGSSQPFTWQDTHPGTAVDYYRLRLETAGGTGVYSDVVALHSIDPNALVTVQPNPFSQSLQFGLPLNAATRVAYRILDLYAHVVQTGEFAGQAGPNMFWVNGLGNIPAGIYLLEVQVGAQRYTQKLIKTE
ncbi:MAG TPA: T9SS type A sorting domain-containing protein [Puia sp.]|nr:T9SS type A sorting domain-containing protein [Puia sp.]